MLKIFGNQARSFDPRDDAETREPADPFGSVVACAAAACGAEVALLVVAGGEAPVLAAQVGDADLSSRRIAALLARAWSGDTAGHGIVAADDDPALSLCAAEPLRAADGETIGALLVLGCRSHGDVAEAAKPVLRHLARIAVAALEQQRRVSAAQRKFEDVFAKIPDPMWIYATDTLRFLDVNEAATRFYGYSRADFLKKTVLDIRPPEDRERLLGAIRDRSDLQAPTKWRHRKADGSLVDVTIQSRGAVFDGKDAVVVVAVDCTDVQALRQDLVNTQLILDTIITALPTGMFLKDMEDQGRYVIFNRVMTEIVGRDAAEVVGRRDREIYGLEGESFIRQDLDVMASGQQRVYDEESVTRGNGKIRQIRTVKKPLPTADGSPPRYLLGICEDITERRRSEDRIAHMALHDSLTDLPNRVLFQQRLERALKRPRKASALALFYLDLDFFKTINDSYGHHIGDELLKQVALRLRSGLRGDDMIARLGGDEFAVLARIPGGGAAAMAVADRILSCFDLPFGLGECVAHVDVSIGIAIASQPGDGGDRLMRHADIALYAAKAEGRGIAKLYADRMSDHVEARQTMSEDLRRAIAEGQFELDYQPLHDLETDRITGFEALLRWRHPTRGLVSPADFIPVAEQTGLIVPIGEWVLGEACRNAAAWPESIKIAVNLSAIQFKKAGLVAAIQRVLADTRLSPQRLELEITESVLLADSGANVQMLHSLRGLGVRIAMDDFGTGYSSLSYLRSFPFDKIKMDRSFVADVCESAGSLAIVRAVTGLGSSLSITTTAEGIETPEQFARLKAEGFDELQGFLIGRPMSPDRARALAFSQYSGQDTASAA